MILSKISKIPTFFKFLIIIVILIFIRNCTPIYFPVNNDSKIVKLGNVEFKMKEVPGAKAKSMKLHLWGDVNEQLIQPFWMAETELTSEVWTEVYIWATGDLNFNKRIDNKEISGKYQFANSGKVENYDPHDLGWDITFDPSDDKNKEYPISFINWNDAIVFCNAITEYYNELYPNYKLSTVYNLNGLPIRDSSNRNFKILNNVEPDNEATGFRLPDESEWLCAASYINGRKWNHAKKASGDYSGRVDRPIERMTQPEFVIGKILIGDIFVKYSNKVGEYAWYDENSNTGNGPEVQQVALKKPNALGLYDMSGNLFEYIWSKTLENETIKRAAKGGSFDNSSIDMAIDTDGGGNPDIHSRVEGIRIVLNY